MPTRQRARDVGAARRRDLTSLLLREVRDARLDRGLAGADVAREVGLSGAQYSRLERGLAGSPSIERASVMLAVVGLELSVRAFPAGEPLRDRSHASLLERFAGRLHPSLQVATEVAFPAPGDRRAWDLVVTPRRDAWRLGVEAETRPRDLQALLRRLALKEQDGDVTSVILLLLDSRHDRALLRAHRTLLDGQFPLDGRRALESLAAGIDPRSNAIVLL